MSHAVAFCLQIAYIIFSSLYLYRNTLCNLYSELSKLIDFIRIISAISIPNSAS